MVKHVLFDVGVYPMSMQKLLIAAVVTVLSFHAFSASQAEQYTVVGPDGKPHVVHTRMGPVVMHRAFPPYTGIHIHQRELERGRRGR
jgi:hypothetical protein